jgi:uncharacterized membrane protein
MRPARTPATVSTPPGAAVLAPDHQAWRDLLLNGLVVGLGLAGNLDQIVLHELLQWHTFYTHTGPFWQRFIDGLFHLAMAAALVAGLARLVTWQRDHPRAWRPRLALAGVLLGLGGFNLFDGIVNHKLLGLHQVREGAPNLWAYDAVFIALALVIFLAGWALWQREQARLAA